MTDTTDETAGEKKVLGVGAVLQQVPDPMNPEYRLEQDGAVTEDGVAAPVPAPTTVPDLGAPDSVVTPTPTPTQFNEEHSQ